MVMRINHVAHLDVTVNGPDIYAVKLLYPNTTKVLDLKPYTRSISQPIDLAPDALSAEDLKPTVTVSRDLKPRPKG